jgi:hypothetical protein
MTPRRERRCWGRTAGRRPRTRFRRGPSARRRMSRPPPPLRLPPGPEHKGGMVTDPNRRPGPSHSLRFGSGCLATRNPRKPSPANPGRNALQKGRASVCPDLTSPLTGPPRPGQQARDRRGDQSFDQVGCCLIMTICGGAICSLKFSVPHSQRGLKTFANSTPRSVREYSTFGGTSLKSLRLTTPSFSNSFRP